MGHHGTSKYSGKLTELFPGFAKRWYGVLYNLIHPKWGEPAMTPEGFMELLDKGIPYLGGDSDKLWRMMAKQGIRRGDPLRKVAELLKAQGVAGYYGSIGNAEIGTILVRRVSLSITDLCYMESFLVALLDNVVVAEVPYFEEVRDNRGYSDRDKHTLASGRCLVYKDSLERFQKDPLASAARLVKEHDEVRRDLIQYANSLYAEVKEAISDSRTSYHDPCQAIHDALESTITPEIEEVELMVRDYERGLKASRILLDLLKNPRPVLTDPVEIFLRNLPLIAVGAIIGECKPKSMAVAKGLAEYLLANVPEVAEH